MNNILYNIQRYIAHKKKIDYSCIVHKYIIAKKMASQKINRIKVVLVENGKTGKWLAEQVGKNEATVSRWCSNKMQPSLDMLVKIAELLNVDARELINCRK